MSCVLAALTQAQLLHSAQLHSQSLSNWRQIDGAHTLGATAVSWAPAEPKGSLVSGKPPGQPVKRFVSGGCDNAVKVGGHAATCLVHLHCTASRRLRLLKL